MATRVPTWLERVLLPQVSELKGEIKALDAKVGGFESKVEGEFRAVHSEIGRLDEKMESLDKRLEAKIDGLDKRMDVTQRVAVIEERMRELEAKQ
ncbi:MAG: hypothetical protein JRN11_02565 [Nitrososphaerota archaeon]|nr:hypothetical protein [Nitrososphaerota archaeon]MDG7013341.1 hypothetical protein [Nitrososphaerota archaeon]MDG7025611.1 hypothetical protein [Nitrososphaerota archaeon]